MSDDPVEKVLNAEAWTEFCEHLKKAGEVLLRDDLTIDAFDRAEGLRYMTRLLRAGLVSFVEHPGPRHPEFRPMPRLVKMGLDNPDNYYVSASVNPRNSYRISGTRGTIHYLSFAAQSQNFAARNRMTGSGGHLNDSEIALEADGSFEIIASQQEQPGNWLPMSADTSQILIRQTFLDKANEVPVEVRIECLEADGPPAPIDPARVPGQLIGSALYAVGCAQWFADWVMGFDERGELNAFHLPDLEQHQHVGGDPDIRIPLGHWELADDEALVIDVVPPECDYWNVQLANIWAESLDYEHRQVHLNSHTAKLNDDGSFRCIVAHADPGHPNWLDTAGHKRGIMGFRWVRAKALPLPCTRLVKL